MVVPVYAAGFALGGSLIVAIGAQNAFVLRQGLRREHVLVVASLCVAIDCTLIALGVGGFGSLIAAFPAITAVAAWGGAGFLAFYGALSLRSALHPAVLTAREPDGARESRSMRGVALTTLAVSLLNPHVYLDTVVLIGGIAAQYPAATRVWFGLGAASASVMWFFGLAFGARLLAPLFARPAAWRVLDLAITAVMWGIATTLVLGQLG